MLVLGPCVDPIQRQNNFKIMNSRALHIHPNTLRHRLRRFEEATGATLRDPRNLVELWWALERRRLAS